MSSKTPESKLELLQGPQEVKLPSAPTNNDEESTHELLQGSQEVKLPSAPTNNDEESTSELLQGPQEVKLPPAKLAAPSAQPNSDPKPPSDVLRGDRASARSEEVVPSSTIQGVTGVESSSKNGEESASKLLQGKGNTSTPIDTASHKDTKGSGELKPLTGVSEVKNQLQTTSHSHRDNERKGKEK